MALVYQNSKWVRWRDKQTDGPTDRQMDRHNKNWMESQTRSQEPHNNGLALLKTKQFSSKQGYPYYYIDL